MKKKSFESFMKFIFILSAMTSIFAIILISVFIFSEGLPFIGVYGY